LLYRKLKKKIPETIRLLNEYLTTFQADAAAWQELGNLYLSVGSYNQAAFCYEEILLGNPTDHFLHSQLAEIYYTIGGEHNLLKARKHFSESIELQRQKNIRALYGLAMTCHSLALLPKASKDLDVISALHQFATGDLLKLYEAELPSMLPIVQQLFQEQSSILETK
jgi:tetratricopeptide (TPR) repeat protein